MIDKFMMDIRNYTASVSGSIAPAGIILFAVSEHFLFFLSKHFLNRDLLYFPSNNPTVLLFLQFALLMLGMD